MLHRLRLSVLHLEQRQPRPFSFAKAAPPTFHSAFLLLTIHTSSRSTLVCRSYQGYGDRMAVSALSTGYARPNLTPYQQGLMQMMTLC